MKFPPLFASGEWWERYASGRIGGLMHHEAVERANAGVRRRDAMRFAVVGGAVLSLPVTGGASALKNREPHSWRLAAEAALASRKIRATLETIYGRSPFFHLLADDVPGTEADFLPGSAAADVCNNAFRRVSAVLGLDDDDVLSSLRRELKGEAFRRVCAERRLKFHPELSILDALFRFGPDALFCLVN